VPNLLPVKCPAICVDTVRKCPADMMPAPCDAGKFYCGDGHCHAGPSKEFACDIVDSLYYNFNIDVRVRARKVSTFHAFEISRFKWNLNQMLAMIIYLSSVLRN
jgi:hypothetical protein